jgi:hypothetical protein
MGEPFDLGVDGSDRLVGEFFGGTGEGAHALINPSVTLEAGMTGLESSVKWRGTDKVRATSLALPRVYARCLPEDALPGRIAVTRIGLPGPRSAYGQRRRAMANCGAVRARDDHGSAQLAAWPARLRAAVDIALRFAPATSRLDRGEGEIALSTGNLQQAARVADWTTLVLAEERARRPGWSSTSGRARVFTTPRTPGQGRQHGRLG